MKVKSETVVEFLDKLKALVEDIPFTIQVGDDGFEEVVEYQVKNIGKAIELFKLQSLTRLEPIANTQKKYAQEYDELYGKTDIDDSEATRLYKAEFYFAVRRVVKAASWIGEIKNDELRVHIESLIPDDSKYYRMMFSKEFYYSSMAVIDDVVKEIIDQRAKAPQLKLFKE